MPAPIMHTSARAFFASGICAGTSAVAIHTETLRPESVFIATPRGALLLRRSPLRYEPLGKQHSIFLQEQGTGRKLGLLRAWLYAHSLRSQTAGGSVALLESRVQSFNL